MPLLSMKGENMTIDKSKLKFVLFVIRLLNQNIWERLDNDGKDVYWYEGNNAYQ